MTFFIHFFIGFLMAFVGLLPPGMLNMTVVRTTIENNKKSGVLFSLGAALIVIHQAFIALFFANYFVKHSEIIEQLSIVGVIVLFTLSIFFFFQARNKFTGEGEKRKGNYFFMGMFMSSINMLAIPFYFFYSSFFQNKGLLFLKNPYILIFVLGAFLGALSLFILYTNFAVLIEKKAQFIATNINYILSILFFILGILTFFRYSSNYIIKLASVKQKDL